MNTHGSRDRRNPGHLWGLVCVNPFPHTTGKMANRWYVVKHGQMASDRQYLHTDGTWHRYAGYEGSWRNELAAWTKANSMPGVSVTP